MAQKMVQFDHAGSSGRLHIRYGFRSWLRRSRARLSPATKNVPALPGLSRQSSRTRQGIARGRTRDAAEAAPGGRAAVEFLFFKNRCRFWAFEPRRDGACEVLPCKVRQAQTKDPTALRTWWGQADPTLGGLFLSGPIRP
jgi:hypothetical protein